MSVINIDDCVVISIEGDVCEACGRPCQATTVDDGIGHYEYCGSRGYDIRICTVSDCCEATVRDGMTVVMCDGLEIDREFGRQVDLYD